MNLLPYLQNYLPNRRDVLSRKAKLVDHSELLAKSVRAIATGLVNENAKLTLMCRLIGQALEPDATDKAQIKLGGRFFNFLHINNFIIFEQKATSVWEVKLGTHEGFNNYIHSMARKKRIANITQHPGDWAKPFNRGVPIVKKLKSEDQHYYTYDKMPMVYRALNILGRTEWTVNSTILDLMQEGVDGFSYEIYDADVGDAIADVIVRKRESEGLRRWYKAKTQIASKDIEVRVKDSFKENTKLSRKVLSAHSIFKSFMSTFELASDVEGETLYFQHNLCSRGRMYALSTDLSPQGPDFQKALLKFNNPGPISTHWIHVHIANCAGKDKLSFDNRVRWTETNMEDIINIGLAPNSQRAHDFYAKHGIYGEKKTKWQFLAACAEYAQWAVSGEWSLPVGIDATSSGLQFLSAIAKDEGIAQDVNISTCSYAPVGDIYQRIGDALIDAVDLSKAPSLSHLSKGDKALRKLCKRSAMTFPYSCQGGSMGDHLYEDRSEYGDEILKQMPFTECAYLGHLQYEIIKKQLPKAAAVMQAMQDCFTGYDGDAMVSWYGPTGFRVTQDKPRMKSEQIALDFDNHRRIQAVIYRELDSANSREHKMAISPNVVHNLDSSMMVMTICAIADRGIDQFHAVHDQLGAYPGQVDIVAAEARIAFYDIVTSNPEKIAMDQAVPGKYVSPETGDWNPRDVLTAPYFLC